MTPTLAEQKALLQQLQDLVEAAKPPKRQIKVDILIDTNNQLADSVFERLREAYAVMRAAFDEVVHATKVAEQRYRECVQGELADCLYAMRETSEVCEGLRKFIDKVAHEIKKTVCERQVAAPEGAMIRGEFCSARTSYKQLSKIPSFDNDPEGYNLICDWLGIPEDLRDRGKILFAAPDGEFETEVVKINFNGYQDMLEQYRAAGYVLPECVKIRDMGQTANVVCTKKEDLL